LGAVISGRRHGLSVQRNDNERTETAMPSITPSLWFDHNLEDAARFYASVFPNSQIEV